MSLKENCGRTHSAGPRKYTVKVNTRHESEGFYPERSRRSFHLMPLLLLFKVDEVAHVEDNAENSCNGGCKTD